MHDTRHNIDFLDFLKEDFEVLSDERHPAVAKIESFRPAVSTLARHAAQLAVEDVQTCNTALDLVTTAKNKYQELEDFRKKTIEPSRKFVQMINNCVKGVHEQLLQIENDIKIKMLSYKKIEDEKMQEAQEQVRQLSESLGVEISIPNAANSMTNENAAGYFKEYMTFEIENVNLVPDSYWMIDEKAIQRHIDLGVQDIPGVKIVTEKKFFVRRK